MEDFDLAVVGAGWAGLSAALAGADRGWRVALLEAAPRAGGRARSTRLTLGDTVVEVDNGQHLIVGAYSAVLALAARCHAPTTPPQLRSPMALRSTDGLQILGRALPAPLHLASALMLARGLGWSARLQVVRLMTQLRLRGWQVPAGSTVTRLLDTAGQSAEIVARLWEPLCIGALNTEPQRACAATFARVLRDTLGGSRSASDFVLPTVALGAYIADPAVALLTGAGHRFLPGNAARTLRHDGERWWIDAATTPVRARHVVLAVPPGNAARLLAGHADAATLAALDRFEFEPIATVYLFWPKEQAPSLPRWTMLVEQQQRQAYGQWLFDRGASDGWHCASVVVSARGRQWLAARDQDTTSAGAERLTSAIARQVVEQLAVPDPVHVRAIVEKRATFACTPSRPRLALAPPGAPAGTLTLAGDYMWPDYPATLEAAVRSGQAAVAGLSGRH